jgi:uncharacterized membrane protein
MKIMDMRIHPYAVHFAVALIVASVLMFLLAALLRDRPWSDSLLQAARWNLWIGAGCALVSIGTGFVDYISNACDQAAIDATVLHRRSGAVTWWSSLIAAIAVYRTRHRRPGGLLLGWLVLVALAALTATRLGTDLTYVRGLGVANAWEGRGEACFERERQGTAPGVQ